MNNFYFQQPISNILVSDFSQLPLALDLADVKAHLRVDFDDDNLYITNLIKTTILRFEKITGKDLITKTYKTFLDAFPISNFPITIKRSKIQSIISIQYYLNNTLTTFDSSNYYFDESNGLSSIYLYENKYFPESFDYRKNCIIINYTSGFGSTNGSIPFDIKQMLMEYIAFLYKNRGDSCCDNMNIPLNYFATQITNPFC